MGYYIQTPKNLNKAKQLIDLYGAVPIHTISEDTFGMLRDDEALVCVVQNGMFDAAALAYSQREFDDFRLDNSGRRKDWLTMDKTKAHELAGFK